MINPTNENKYLENTNEERIIVKNKTCTIFYLYLMLLLIALNCDGVFNENTESMAVNG